MRYEELSVGILRVKSMVPQFFSDQKVPASGLKGYAAGQEIYLSNAVYGMAGKWVNVGTVAGCLFTPVGPVMGGYGIARGGYRADTTGSATQNFTVDDIRASDLSLVEYSASDDNDQVLAQIPSDGKITMTLSADPLAAHGHNWLVMRSRCVPDYEIFAAGTVATVGGAAAEAFTISGVQAGDMAFVTYSATDDTDTIAKAVCTANTLTVTFSANPLTAHGIHYIILRPRGNFKPSHYIFAAANYTTVGGAAAEAISITGLLATDVAIVKYRATDDTDTILKAVCTAGTLTVTFSADPGATHAITYLIARAYPT